MVPTHLGVGGSNRVAFAFFSIAATLVMSIFPTNATREVDTITAAKSIRTDHEEDNSSSSNCGVVLIEDFRDPDHEWKTMNDPVMGGKSTSSVSITDGIANFKGTCEIVDFLQAPGFITMRTGGHFAKQETFPDVSNCQGLSVNIRSTVDYLGYYLSFGTDRVRGGRHASGYKTYLDLAASEEFAEIKLPFSEFSSKWDEKTGKVEITCQEDPQYCPSLENLQDMKTISFWGEGVEGTVTLDVKSIRAYGCAGAKDESKISREVDTITAAKSIRTDYAEDNSSSSNCGGVLLEDFRDPDHEWKTMNDPVMGGKSTSSVSITDGIANFKGTCEIVDFLQAPGFITMRTGGHFAKQETFPDVSNCQGLSVNIRSTVDYLGYYLSFGTDRVRGGHHASGYKTHLDLAASEEFAEIKLPFSEFSSKWDEKTGKVATTCQEDPQYCPSLENLQDMKTISFWGEGVEGTVALDVKSIRAYGCAGAKDENKISVARLALGMAGVSSSQEPMFRGQSLVWIGVVGVGFAIGFILGRRRENSTKCSSSAEYIETDVVGTLA